MSRYVRRTGRPRASQVDPDQDWSFFPSLQVDEAKWVNTGLVDDAGNKIWRGPDPLGFGKREGWIRG